QLAFQRPVLGLQIEKRYLHSPLASFWLLRHRLRHAQDARRVPGDDCSGRDVPRHDRPRSHHGPLADRDAPEQHRARPDRRAALYESRNDRPVSLRLDVAAICGGAGIEIVDEADVVPYEHLILDRHALTDEAMALDLATR